MKVAALDLGTNTFLCLIAEGDRANGITKVYKDLMKVVRLGQDIDKTKRLHPEALVRARECLTEFKKEIDEQKVDRILAMATSAARDAENGDELFQIGRELNIPIEIIPGADEARITYCGATAGSDIEDRNVLVVDVGGGSTEFILGRGREILFGKSLDIGGVRLTERHITSQPVSLEEKINLREHIERELKKILPDLQKHNIHEVMAVAGTPTAVVAIEVGGFDEKKVDGYRIARERLRYWVETFGDTTVEEKKVKYALGGRADIIFAGTSILLATLEGLNIDSMLVSTKGVRYGVALEMLQE